MNGSKWGKLLGLMVGTALLNIIVWSPGLLGVEISGANALESAAGITVLCMSVVILCYGSYTLLLKPPAAAPPVHRIQTHEDYITALHHYRNVKVLKHDIAHALDQLERMEKKKQALLHALSQRFQPAELSFRRFASVIHEVEKLFYLNIRGLLNKLGVFDASDFAAFASRQGSGPYPNRIAQQKAELYQEYLSYVSGYLGANEEIMLKLDKLLLELTRLGSADYRDIEEMPGMKEIDQLIKQTQFYKP